MRATRLTPAELARTPEFIQHWIRISLSATPIDHQQAERVLGRLYAAAGLTAPRVVWAPCPMTAMLSAIVYTAIRNSGPGVGTRRQECPQPDGGPVCLDRDRAGRAPPPPDRKLGLEAAVGFRLVLWR